MSRTIATLDDIRLMTDTFYAKVRADDLLKGIFNLAIGDRWPEHLAQMYRFWQTVLLEEHTYFGHPFAPHASMPLQPGHFNRWLTLFNETIDELFTGEKATEAKWRAERMALTFNHKLQSMHQDKERS